MLRDYDAEALNGQAAELPPSERERIARALREDLIGLGAIAERMLSDLHAQEWQDCCFFSQVILLFHGHDFSWDYFAQHLSSVLGGVSIQIQPRTAPAELR